MVSVPAPQRPCSHWCLGQQNNIWSGLEVCLASAEKRASKNLFSWLYSGRNSGQYLRYNLLTKIREKLEATVINHILSQTWESVASTLTTVHSVSLFPRFFSPRHSQLVDQHLSAGVSGCDSTKQTLKVQGQDLGMTGLFLFWFSLTSQITFGTC